jgi:hypothetical protein
MSEIKGGIQMELKTTVRYSCDLCGLEKIPVDVRAREEEDVLVWMEYVGRCLAEDHFSRSPHCRPKTLSRVMIPMLGTDRIGGPAIQ